MRPLSLAGAGLLALVVCGCTTVSIRKVEPLDYTPGFRFSLPSRFVMVEPQPDGSVKTRVTHLPDVENTFAITGETWLAKNKLAVKVAEGLLTEISFTNDTTAVPSQLATSGGAVRAKDVTADVTAVSTLKTKRETLLQKIREAELAVAQAQARYDISSEELGENNLKTIEARIALRLAELTLKDLRTQLEGLGVDPNYADGLFNNPDKTPTRAYGPIFFRIVEALERDDPNDPRSEVSLRVYLEPAMHQGLFKVRAQRGDDDDSVWEDSASCSNDFASGGAMHTQDSLRFEVTFSRHTTLQGFKITGFESGSEVLSRIEEMVHQEGEVVVFSAVAAPQESSYQIQFFAVNGLADCSPIIHFSAPPAS